ncbi:MAG: hypothetical protein D8M57_11170, partial [Candidatus Scalindua sp. AMX11]
MYNMLALGTARALRPQTSGVGLKKYGSFTECVGKNKEKHRFNCSKAQLKEYFLFPSPPPTSLLGEGG